MSLTSDNVSNFAKAFSLFAAADEASNEEHDEMMYRPIHSDRRWLPVPGNETDGPLSDDGVMLPPHKTRGNHSLNLVAANDALKAREDEALSKT